MIAVGIMSGTSADGASLAAIQLREHRLRLLAYRTFPYRPGLRERVIGARTAAAPELSALHADLGHFFARCARTFIRKGHVDVIGSHGQTVWHEPGRHTFQLGEASLIVEATGVTTVCDFRPRDLAAGGQGAPLVPYFDWFLWRRRPVVLLNLGGIANITVPGSSLHETIGFDTGPGNALIDEAMRIAWKRECDRGGRVAASGKVDPVLLRSFDHPYFAKRPPKSTGRELFSREFLLDRAEGELHRRPADVIATLTYLTARTVADAIRKFVKRPVQEIIVSGGGRFNRTLVSHLEWLTWPTAVRPIDVYGFHPLSKEPAAFALLAVEAVRGVAANVPSATGARRSVVLGKILPGSGFRRLMRTLHR
jgi:anhydro-N-acetylmuramic acid kinase